MTPITYGAVLELACVTGPICSKESKLGLVELAQFLLGLHAVQTIQKMLNTRGKNVQSACLGDDVGLWMGKERLLTLQTRPQTLS